MFNQPSNAHAGPSAKVPRGADALLAAVPAEARDGARHLVIAGPTASGKSALALALARQDGGIIVNADAFQIWDCWRLLTARPSTADESSAPHRLYGHVPPGRSHSVGDWLKDVARLLEGGERLIVVGGTGLFLTALTRGLAVIPPISPEVRAEADARLARGGLADMVAALDDRTRARIDIRNPARVQRAWEVLSATGRGLADWQERTGPPLLGDGAVRLVLHADRDWLAARIARRFDAMLSAGVLDEVVAVRPIWDPAAQWARAIGAAELMAHLQGQMALEDARAQAVTATRQYAKSQRSWFRNRMGDWTAVPVGD